MGRPSAAQPGEVWALINSWARSHPLDPNQRQIARLLEVSASLLSAWKYCQSTMQPDDMERVSAAIGVSYSVLASAVRADHERVRTFQAAKAARADTAIGRLAEARDEAIASDLDPDIVRVANRAIELISAERDIARALAARKTGRKGSSQLAREKQDRAGTENQDDGGMEPA